MNEGEPAAESMVAAAAETKATPASAGWKATALTPLTPFEMRAARQVVTALETHGTWAVALPAAACTHAR